MIGRLPTLERVLGFVIIPRFGAGWRLKFGNNTKPNKCTMFLSTLQKNVIPINKIIK
jgi:hypothetical protein